MKNRLISTVLLWLGITIPLFIFGGHAAAILLAIASILTQRELYLMMATVGMRPYRLIGYIFGTLLILGTYYLPKFGCGFDISTGGEILLLGVVAATVQMVFCAGKPNQLQNLSATILGLVFIPFMLHFIILLIPLFGIYTEGYGLMVAVWLVAVTKFTDAGALLVGRKIGKNKMAPSISPGKTIEGAIGGVITTVLVGLIIRVVFHRFFPENFGIIDSILVSIPVAIVSIFSDLSESVIKRQAGIKDSGKIFPGIGGAFDLMDSLVLAAPLGYFLIKLLS